MYLIGAIGLAFYQLVFDRTIFKGERPVNPCFEGMILLIISSSLIIVSLIIDLKKLKK